MNTLNIPRGMTIERLGPHSEALPGFMSWAFTLDPVLVDDDTAPGWIVADSSASEVFPLGAEHDALDCFADYIEHMLCGVEDEDEAAEWQAHIDEARADAEAIRRHRAEIEETANA